MGARRSRLQKFGAIVAPTLAPSRRIKTTSELMALRSDAYDVTPDLARRA